MRRSFVPVLSFLLVTVSVAPAYSFDGEEHAALSNLALRAALDSLPGAPELRSEVGGMMAESGLGSFGAMTALADYTHDVSDLLANPRRAIGLPAAKGDIDWEHLEKVARNKYGYLQATHENYTHFRGAALERYWNLHERAKSLAASQELFAALIVEAYADHFLQDFYAPGHVVTPRDEITGFASLALHDRANRRGRRFVFEAGAGEALRPLWLALEAGLPTPPATTGKGEALPIRFDRQALEELRQALSSPGGSLEFRGDGDLKDHAAQAAFVILATAASIREVLRQARPDLPDLLPQEASAAAAANDLTSLCFFEGSVATEPASGEGAKPGEELGTEVCGKPAGQWEVPGAAGSASGGRDGRRGARNLRVAKTLFGHWDLSQDSYDFRDIGFTDLLILSAFGAWSPRGSTENGGGGLKLEGLLYASTEGVTSRVFGAPKDGDPSKRRSASEGTHLGTFGFSYRGDEKLTAEGAQIRYIFPLPGIDIQGYFSYGRERVQVPRRSSWEDAWSVGIETGYGLFYFNLGYQRLAVLGDRGKTEAKNLLGFGVTVMVPRSVFKFLQKGEIGWNKPG